MTRWVIPSLFIGIHLSLLTAAIAGITWQAALADPAPAPAQLRLLSIAENLLVFTPISLAAFAIGYSIRGRD